MFTKFIEKHGLKKIVVPLVIVVLFFGAVIWLTPSQMTAQSNGLMPTPTVTVREVPVYSDSEESDFPLAYRIFIAVIWPFAFVLFAFILDTLVSSRNRAKNEHKFEVKFEDDTQKTEYVIYPLSLDDLKEILNDRNKKVIDIEVLDPGMLQSINLGIDLCIAAVAADLSTIFALTSSDLTDFSRPRLISIISIIVSHTILALLVALMLKNAKKSEYYTIVIWIANIFGFLSLVSSFYLL